MTPGKYKVKTILLARTRAVVKTSKRAETFVVPRQLQYEDSYSERRQLYYQDSYSTEIVTVRARGSENFRNKITGSIYLWNWSGPSSWHTRIFQANVVKPKTGTREAGKSLPVDLGRKEGAGKC